MSHRNELSTRWITALAAPLLLSAPLLLPAPLLGQVRAAPTVNNAAAVPPSTATTATALRALTAPIIDGRDNDEIWQRAPLIDQFLEYDPNEGAETRFRTNARVAYDDRNLYVFVRMYDPAPDSIVSLLSRRDVRTPSEQLKLVIDSYHDRRTAYQFAVNPAGVKRDFYVYDDITEDISWDAVWDVATTIDSLGWTAEFSIPLSQMRFGRQDEHTFGLMIVRDVARTNERISWPLYRRNQHGYVSQSGTVTGFSGIPSPRRVEFLPYVVTSNSSEPRSGGYGRAQRFTGGADLKLGLASNLTLDATVNPDFGQVEADPAVLNLGAFETFFSERRPFFLEGTGIFGYRVNCGDIDTGCTGPFYSRRIGRSPQLRSLYGDARSPTSTSILGATKLTGRLANGLSVGVLNAVTERVEGPQAQTLEPLTNYFVTRAQQDFRGGRSGVGIIATAVNRSLDEWSVDYLRREAYTAGVDLRHRFLDQRYELAASATASHVTGSQEAIAELQLDGVHRFQRPDDGVEFDPTRTSLGGNAQRLSLSKFGGGILRFQSVLQRVSPGFEINDAGFLSRADEQIFRNWMSLNLHTPKYFYRRAFLNFNYGQSWTTEGLPIGASANYNWHIELKNSMWVHVGTTAAHFLTTYADREARGGPAIRRSPAVDYFFGVEGDRRRQVAPTVFFGGVRGDEGNSHGWWVNPGLEMRAASNIAANVSMNYSRMTDGAQWVGNFTSGGETAYTFARLEQSTLGLTLRGNYTATPNLSLQLYANPFISTGEFSDWRELDAPRAEAYADRYRPYTAGGDPGGFKSMQFRSNSVLRWEYRPGSTIFLVWTQGRSGSVNEASRFNLGRDANDLFGLHPDNTFLIKASYWFNP
jgi:hypothetical protein